MWTGQVLDPRSTGNMCCSARSVYFSGEKKRHPWAVGATKYALKRNCAEDLPIFSMFSSESKGDRGDERGAGMRMNPHTGLPFSPRYFELFR